MNREVLQGLKLRQYVEDSKKERKKRKETVKTWGMQRYLIFLEHLHYLPT